MARKLRGVTIRGPESIQIEFHYQGQRCREILKMPASPENLRYAANLRAGILAEIARGNFDYLAHFPSSTSKIARASKTGCHISVEEALKDWLRSAEKRHAYSTVRDYGSSVYYHLIPTFGHFMLDELTRGDIERWIRSLELSNKRINNVLIPLRQVLTDAYCDELIPSNPMDRIKNLRVQTREPEPFTLLEISKILSELSGAAKNTVQFGFWTGVRVSELLALRWCNVNIKANTVAIREALVRGRIKEPKTTAGRREITLHENAMCAIKEQTKLTGKSEFVFFDPKTKTRWPSDQPFRKRLWIPALKHAGVRYREPYQMRHTFASQMLKDNRNHLWLARHMGHSDFGMIRKVYGRWIPDY